MFVCEPSPRSARPAPDHLKALDKRLGSLPKEREIVAYCRGPYCILAPEAVRLLRARGYRAVAMGDGVAEWRAQGLPVAVGDAP